MTFYALALKKQSANSSVISSHKHKHIWYNIGAIKFTLPCMLSSSRAERNNVAFPLFRLSYIVFLSLSQMRVVVLFLVFLWEYSARNNIECFIDWLTSQCTEWSIWDQNTECNSIYWKHSHERLHTTYNFTLHIQSLRTYCKYAVEYDDQPSNEVHAAPTVHYGSVCATLIIIITMRKFALALAAVLHSSIVFVCQQLVNTQDPK